MDKRIRVGQIIYGFGPEGGGAARFAVDLSRSLDPQRFERRIFALWDMGSAVERERTHQLGEQGIEALAASRWEADKPYASFGRAWQELRTELARQPADILHSHSEFGDVAALLARGLGSRPKILRTIHNGHQLEWRRRPLRRLLLTNLLYPLRFDQEIGVSQSIVDQLNRRPVARLLRRQGRLFPNAIDLERFSGAAQRSKVRAELNLDEDAILVGSAGRMAEEKGFRYLIEAAAQICQDFPRVRFVLAGSGPLQNELHEQAQRLGLEGRLLYAGYRSDIEDWMAGLDLFVSSSLWEGLPTAILESMAAGVPVVATDIEANRGLITDRQNGWLAAPGDGAALASAIAEALRGEEERKAFARRSCELVKRFSIQSIAAEIAAVYEDLAGKASG
jgi:glycosyltransferase involved in cell wall biosynthesis